MRYVLVLATIVFAVVAATFLLGGHPRATSVHRVLAIPIARGAAGGEVGVTIKVRTLDDAKAILSRASRRLNVGLTGSEIASTRSIYHFPSTTGSYAAGLDAYRAPLANGGNCIAFAAAVGCTRTRPNDAEPIVALALDPDAERTGEPFVVIGTKAPDVRAVTYTCGGRTYPATVSGDVVTFIAPSSSLRADDCTENVTLAGGKVVSKRV
jgi:hypothetical protein